MSQSYLKAFETEFDSDEVSVVGCPQVIPRQPGSGTFTRYLPGPLDQDPEEVPAAESDPPPPTFSQADLDAAVAEAQASAAEAARAACEQAREEAREETLNGVAAAQAEAVQGAGRQLAELQTAFDKLVDELRDQGRTLLLEVLRVVTPRALGRAPLADVEYLLQDVVPRLGAEPKLHLELAPDLVDVGRSTFEQIAAESGFRGEIEVTPDPALERGDVRLRWEKGEAERNAGDLAETALEIAKAWLESAEPRPEDVTDTTEGADVVADSAAPPEAEDQP